MASPPTMGGSSPKAGLHTPARRYAQHIVAEGPKHVLPNITYSFRWLRRIARQTSVKSDFISTISGVHGDIAALPMAQPTSPGSGRASLMPSPPSSPRNPPLVCLYRRRLLGGQHLRPYFVPPAWRRCLRSRRLSL